MKLVLIRHGQSEYNLEKRFCGWTDVSLNENGINEAHNAGKLLKDNNFNFDVAFTSVLKRANDTLDIVLKELNINIPVYYNWKLNERHYGALQGLKHEEMEQKYGKEQVHIWRRSYDVRPPELDLSDERHPKNDLKYKDIDSSLLPSCECLKDTLKRVVEYYNSDIKKYLEDKKDVLIVAHGNSLRALIKYLENISDDNIMEVEIPTGKPYVYELDNQLNIINKYYL